MRSIKSISCQICHSKIFNTSNIEPISPTAFTLYYTHVTIQQFSTFCVHTTHSLNVPHVCHETTACVIPVHKHVKETGGRGQLKCDGTHAETRFRLSAKQMSPFKTAGASVHSTTGSRGVRISGSNAGYTMFRGSVKGTGYPLHSPVSPSLPRPCVAVCHHISTGVYQFHLYSKLLVRQSMNKRTKHSNK